MAKKILGDIPIVFEFPFDDEELMGKIYEANRQLIVMKYQNVYDSLADEEKEIGFEILNKKFKEEYGAEYSLRLT